MNKMFNRVEEKLKTEGKTKVWLANALNESTQNINNWKKRGIPAIKVKRIADILGVSREYLEGSEHVKKQQVETSRATYNVDKVDQERINYIVFIDTKESMVKQLLAEYLHNNNGMSYLHCTAWSNTEPFLELSLWKGAAQKPWNVLVLKEFIIGITDYIADQ